MSDSPRASGELRAPPPLSVDDHGLAWRREGAALVLERRPTLRGAKQPLGLSLGFGALGAGAWYYGDVLPGALFAAMALFALVGVGIAARQRVRVTVGSIGVRWEAEGPRARSGHWARDQVTAARFRAGRKPVKWGMRQHFFAEVRVKGQWVALASGTRRARAEELAGALAAALGVAAEQAPAAAEP